MARPAILNRKLIKEYRLTVKVPASFEARIKSVALRKHEGNGSALVREAVEKYLTEFETAASQE